MAKISIKLLLVTILCVACNRYYKLRTSVPRDSNETAQRIDSLQNRNRYFILRNGDNAFAMTNCLMTADRKSVTCQLEPLPASHLLHLAVGSNRKMRYRGNDPMNVHVLSEVHFYTLYDSLVKSGKYLLALDRVNRIEIIEHDKKRTTNSYVIGALGYTVGAAVIVGIIIAATKSSCPFVSAYNEGEFVLQGEIYGGAIYPQLARHDYMPLKMSPSEDGSLQLKISNELQERQYTDMADLQVITHDSSTKVWTDQFGNLYPVSSPQSPVSASLNARKTAVDAVCRNGDLKVLYMDDSSKTNAQNELVLSFNHTPGPSRAKLLLSLKNSYWLDFLYGELAKGFGDYYATYIKEQRTKPAAELLKWINEQQIPLHVSIRDGESWKEITTITTIGPLANRDVIVPIDLTGIQSQQIEIKLSAGFMFWEIDYAAVDFTAGSELDVQVVSPHKAYDETGRNVLPSLTKEDGIYLDQPQIGNAATLFYQPPRLTDPGKMQTYILHTKGYYEHIRDFQNKPDLLFLSQFKKPNAFPVFGMRLFQSKEKDLQLFAIKPAE